MAKNRNDNNLELSFKLENSAWRPADPEPGAENRPRARPRRSPGLESGPESALNDTPGPGTGLPPPAPPPISPRELRNQQATQMANFLELEGIQATGGNRRFLMRYTGTGGITSSQESGGQYFTPYAACRLITDLVNVSSGAKVYDPTCGTARFAEFLPPGCEFTGIEIDAVAARVGKLLYPQHAIENGDILNNLHFRECFDTVLGNPPFGLWWKVDPRKSNVASAAGKIVSQWKILEAAITAVKKGGIISLVIPKNTFTNDRAADQRAAQFWNSNCIVRAEIDLPPTAFKASGTTWPCSFIIIQRAPAAPAPTFRFEFIDLKAQYKECVKQFRYSDAYRWMKSGEGALLKDRREKKKIVKINKEFVAKKKKFEYIFSGDIETETETDIVYVRRAGHLLTLKPNGIIAALKLEQWKQIASGGYSSKPWQQACTVDHIVLRDSVKGFKEVGLSLEFDPDLQNYLRGKRKFYRKENLKMSDVPNQRETQYLRHLDRLKQLGIWDKLFPYQRHDAAIHAIKNFSFMGYIQGLGKSRAVIAAVMLKGTKRNLYICYSRLVKKVWYEELLTMGIDKDDIKIIRKPADLHDVRQHNIISFETMRKQDRTLPPIPCEVCGATVKGKICMAPNPDPHDDRKTCGWHRFKNASCPDCGTVDDYTGRYCGACGYADSTWKPAIYRRMRKLFSCIVVDESQASKNRNSQQGRALRTIKAKHKIILTGTILENYVSEAYWQLWWLLGASCRFPYPYHGGHNMFCNRFCEFTTTKSGRRKMLPSIKNEKIFYDMMDSIMTRRTEKDKQVREVIQLPGYTDSRIHIEPTEAEKELYEQAVDNFEEWYLEQLRELDKMSYWLKGDGKKKLSAAVLVKLNALRRVSSCPFCYAGYGGNGTAKIKFIRGVVEEKTAKGEKVLISSAFKPLVHELVKNIPYSDGFTGEMPIPKRDIIMSKFQDEDLPRALIVTTQCCNLGVTLTRASTAILSDMLWSPKQMEQMWKRIHRVGQRSECEILYLINEGFIDEDIHKLTVDKDRAINKAIDRIDSVIDTEFFSPLDFANKMLAGRGRRWVKKYMEKGE